MSNWQTIFKTSILHQAEIVKAILADKEIPSVIVNKKDSSYLLGLIEVKVGQQDIMKALKIIEEDTEFK